MKNILKRIVIYNIVIALIFLGGGYAVVKALPESQFMGHLYPMADLRYNLGSITARWLGVYSKNLYVSNTLSLGGVVYTSANISGAEIDPIFTASDVFGVTTANITGWNTHPTFTTGIHGVGVSTVASVLDISNHAVLTTGTHGVGTGNVTGTTLTQELTNKTLTASVGKGTWTASGTWILPSVNFNASPILDNNILLQWKDVGGTPQDMLRFGSWLDILPGESYDIIVWSGSGTGQTLYLNPTDSDAVNPTRNAPTLEFGKRYWAGGTNHQWGTQFEDYMIDTAPHSRLVISTNDTAIIGFENDAGIPATVLFGNLDANSFGINNVVDPTLAQDAATKNYVDANISGNVTGFVPYTGATDNVNLGNKNLSFAQAVAEPSSTANKAGIYAIDLSADNCTIGFFTETTVESALGVAGEKRMPVRWNGQTYYLLAENSSYRTPIINTIEPTIGQGLQVGQLFFNSSTDTWKKCTNISPLVWTTLPSGGATAWGDISGNITAQYDLQGALNGKLSVITGVELDNIFSSNGLLKRTGLGTYAIDDSNYLTSFTEEDPIFGESIAYGIQSSNITSWNTAYGWGNHALAGYLTSFTELDPEFGASVAHGILSENITSWNNKLSSITGSGLDNVFSSSGLLKRTGIATYSVDSSAYLTGNQNITISGDITGSGTTSISANVSGIGGKTLPTLSAGLLRYSGSAFSYDNASYLIGNQNISLTGAVTGSGATSIATTLTAAGLDNIFGSNGLLKRAGVATYTLDTNTYLTANQNITLSSDASGSGTTSIAVTNTGLKGVALPTLATGYLYYNGSAWAFQTPAGGSNPAWYGKLYATRSDCNPITQAEHENMLAVAAPTPTNITASIARCVQFTPPANITVASIRLFGVGATTNLYKFAIYPVGTSTAKTWDSGTITTASNAWKNITTGLPITLTAGTKYWWCVTVVSTGTTAGFRSEAAPLGTNYWGANVAPLGGTSLGLPVYAQFAVSTGVFPATLPTIAAAAYAGGTTGSVPAGWLDYGGAK